MLALNSHISYLIVQKNCYSEEEERFSEFKCEFKHQNECIKYNKSNYKSFVNVKQRREKLWQEAFNRR